MCLAIPGRLVGILGEGDLRVGEVDFGGVSREANLAFVPEAVVGDYVLVHVGFALAVIDEQVAHETLEALTGKWGQVHFPEKMYLSPFSGGGR